MSAADRRTLRQRLEDELAEALAGVDDAPMSERSIDRMARAADEQYSS